MDLRIVCKDINVKKDVDINRTEKYYKYYSDEEEKESLRYHNERIGCRRIGKLLEMDPKSVVKWVRKRGKANTGYY